MVISQFGRQWQKAQKFQGQHIHMKFKTSLAFMKLFLKTKREKKNATFYHSA